MSYLKLLAVFVALALSLSCTCASWAYEEAKYEEYRKTRDQLEEEYKRAKAFLDEEYRRARTLVMEENFNDAREIYNRLAELNPSDIKVRLGLIDATLEEARVLKEANISSWKIKVYSAFWDLKELYLTNFTSPEVFLSFAKCYWLNNRPRKANRSLKKAFYYNPDFTDALIFKGDMFFEESTKNLNPAEPDSDKDIYKARKSAEKSYEMALTRNNLDSYTEVMVRYKLGKLYKYHGLFHKAEEQWNKAASTAPESHWGKKAQDGLLALK